MTVCSLYGCYDSLFVVGAFLECYDTLFELNSVKLFVVGAVVLSLAF